MHLWEVQTGVRSGSLAVSLLPSLFILIIASVCVLQLCLFTIYFIEIGSAII